MACLFWFEKLEVKMEILFYQAGLFLRYGLTKYILLSPILMVFNNYSAISAYILLSQIGFVLDFELDIIKYSLWILLFIFLIGIILVGITIISQATLEIIQLAGPVIFAWLEFISGKYQKYIIKNTHKISGILLLAQIFPDYKLFLVIFLSGIFIFLEIQKNYLYPKKFKKSEKIKILRSKFIQPHKNKYNISKIPPNLDIIIIGSGIGGLTPGSLLSRCGYRVLVLDQHESQAGGATHTFEQNGFEFDIGIHYIGQIRKREKILNLLTAEPIKFAKMGQAPDYIYDEIYIGSDNHNFRPDKNNFISDLVKKFPSQKSGLEKYVELIELVASKELFFGIKIFKPRWLANFIGKFCCAEYYKYLNLTTYQVISSLISDEKLIAILTAQFGDIGLTPKNSSFFIHASIVNHYLEGGWYPENGSAEFAKKIIPVIESYGGAVLVGQRVSKILIKNNIAYGIRMENGDEIFANIIISDAGIYNTYQKLIPKDLAIQDPLFEISTKIKPSCSFVYLFVGLEADNLNLRSSNIWSLPEINFDKLLEDFNNKPFDPDTKPLVFIGFPSAKDPAWRSKHPDKSTCVILSTCKYELFQKFSNIPKREREQNPEYQEIKKKYTEILLGELYKYYPELRDIKKITELGTPLSFNYYIGSSQGEVYGLESNPFRYSCMDIKPETSFKNLYLTGQDITTLGFTGAMMAGVLTTHNILGYGNILDAISGRNLIDDINHLVGNKKKY